MAKDGKTVRLLMKTMANYGFKQKSHANPNATLLAKRDDEYLFISSLLHKETLLDGRRSFIERLRGLETDGTRVFAHAATVFVTLFPLLEIDRLQAEGERICLIEPGELDGLLRLYVMEDPTARPLSPQQLILATKTRGVCRRLANAYQKAGDLSQALQWRKTFYNMNHNSIEAGWALADLEFRMGMLDSARYHATNTYKLNPANLGLLLLLVDTYTKLGDLTVAAELARDAVVRFPTSASAKAKLLAIDG